MDTATFLSQDQRYTITLDRDPEVHATIAQATGMCSRWYSSCDDVVGLRDLDPVAVFLDIGLSLDSSLNGQLIPRFKDSWPLSPVILTTQSNDTDMLPDAMALGADDFVGKPIQPSEIAKRLDVRLKALAKKAARETIRFNNLVIDTLQRSVSTTHGQKFLSPTEISLLAELAKSAGTVVSRETLKHRCWPREQVSDNALNRKLYEVRRRIRPLSEQINIRTIYGVGFILEEKK